MEISSTFYSFEWWGNAIFDVNWEWNFISLDDEHTD